MKNEEKVKKLRNIISAFNCVFTCFLVTIVLLVNGKFINVILCGFILLLQTISIVCNRILKDNKDAWMNELLCVIWLLNTILTIAQILLC